MSKLTLDQVNKIAELRAKNTRTKDIAKALKVHPTAVRYWYRRLIEAGHALPPEKMGRPKLDLTKQ